MYKPLNKAELRSGMHTRHFRSAEMSDDQFESRKIIRTQPHHRRPRSLGGSRDDPSNISFVRPKPHNHWHTLFGNLNAMEICDLINMSPWKPEEVTVECVFINGSRVTKKGGKNHSEDLRKREIAWEQLFGGLSFSRIISYINNVWLDPSYHFYIRREK